MAASGVVATFAVAGSCLRPFITAAPGVRLPSFRLLFTLPMLYADIALFGTDDNVARWNHLAGATWGALYYLSLLRKPRSVAFLKRQA